MLGQIGDNFIKEVPGQMHLSINENPKHDWHSAFGDKRLCYSRATAGTFILNLIYISLRILSRIQHKTFLLDCILRSARMSR